MISIRPKEMAKRLGISRTTLWRLEKDREQGFPRRIQLTRGTVAYLLVEVDEWIASRHRVGEASSGLNENKQLI